MLTQTFFKSIQLTFNVPQNLSLVVADSTQIYQILMNLCVNARDVMPNGGRLTISAENTVLDERSIRVYPEGRPGQYVQLRVVDCKTNIPHDMINKIFDPFFTTKKIDHDTKLKLSTILRIVKAHNKFINVYNE